MSLDQSLLPTSTVTVEEHTSDIPSVSSRNLPPKTSMSPGYDPDSTTNIPDCSLDSMATTPDCSISGDPGVRSFTTYVDNCPR